ncbi:MAG: response regulator [Phycisphaera sp.]|nr:response regulator [Phycisphaera sp.]
MSKARGKSNGPSSKAYLLVVEDEKDLQDLLNYNLTREGFKVVCTDRGEQGLEIARQHPPDLVVLDLMLPGMDGLDVCRNLKSDPNTAHVPIVMLTAKGEESDVVIGLEMGADDYVTKPFSPRVLIARLKAVLRRPGAASPAEADAETKPAIRINELQIIPDRHEVRVGEETIELTATEFRLLYLLARRPGRVFTRQQIIDALHDGFAAVTDRSVDVHVVSLRRKLSDAGRHIKTVRGVGYRLEE